MSRLSQRDASQLLEVESAFRYSRLKKPTIRNTFQRKYAEVLYETYDEIEGKPIREIMRELRKELREFTDRALGKVVSVRKYPIAVVVELKESPLLPKGVEGTTINFLEVLGYVVILLKNRLYLQHEYEHALNIHRAKMFGAEMPEELDEASATLLSPPVIRAMHFKRKEFELMASRFDELSLKSALDNVREFGRDIVCYVRSKLNLVLERDVETAEGLIKNKKISHYMVSLPPFYRVSREFNRIREVSCSLAISYLV